MHSQLMHSLLVHRRDITCSAKSSMTRYWQLCIGNSNTILPQLSGPDYKAAPRRWELPRPPGRAWRLQQAVRCEPADPLAAPVCWTSRVPHGSRKIASPFHMASLKEPLESPKLPGVPEASYPASAIVHI